ncbi:hypothetical protein CK1_38790 [Ruminococcus sp. SR1/5]|nr:hypothetical protein CK1_38790 [Ruminococcus sp. SR1/5]
MHIAEAETEEKKQDATDIQRCRGILL